MSAPTAELKRLDVVFLGELSFASGVSEKTLRRRIHLPAGHPERIPYLAHLGKPYRVTRETATWFLSENRGVSAA